MNIKPIKTKQDYDYAMSAIDERWDAKPNTPDGDMPGQTRVIEARQVMTIEPGLYFIDSLLEDLNAT